MSSNASGVSLECTTPDSAQGKNRAGVDLGKNRGVVNVQHLNLP